MKINPIVVFLLSILFASCEFSESDIKYNMGNDFINDPTVVYMIDTLTVNTYTTTVDTFSTSRTNRFLTGKAKGYNGMETTCETYLSFETSEASVFHTTAVYDSILLMINLDGYNCGDTTQTGEFGVYRLTEKIAVDTDSKYIFNTSRFPSESTPLAKFVIDYRKSEKLIPVKLPDELGKEFFQLTKDKSELMTDPDLFMDYFKGVVIKPIDDNSTFVAGINGIPDSMASPRIRVYYHDNTITDDLYFDFPLEKYELTSTTSTQFVNYRSFNYINNNYQGTKLEGIKPGEAKLSSNNTNNVSFLQAGAMLRTRIEIPNIDNLYQFGVGSIVKAELYMEPVEGTYFEKADLPSTLQMRLVDHKNRDYNALYVTGTTDEAFGYLNFNKEFKHETNYTYDITNFIKTEYEDRGDPVYSMLMYLPFNALFPNIDQLVIGNNRNAQHKIKLKIYLTSYK